MHQSKRWAFVVYPSLPMNPSDTAPTSITQILEAMPELQKCALLNLTDKANELHARADGKMRSVVEDLAECGRVLKEIQDGLPPGFSMKSWVENNFNPGRTAAYRCMKLNERRAEWEPHEPRSMAAAFRIIGQYQDAPPVPDLEQHKRPKQPQKQASICCEACRHTYSIMESDGSCPHCFAPYQAASPVHAGNAAGDMGSSGSGGEVQQETPPPPGTFYGRGFNNLEGTDHEPTSTQTPSESHSPSTSPVAPSSTRGGSQVVDADDSAPNVGGSPRRRAKPKSPRFEKERQSIATLKESLLDSINNNISFSVAVVTEVVTLLGRLERGLSSALVRDCPPSADDVEAYALELSLDEGPYWAHRFHDYQTASDWQVGSKYMVDWHAAFRDYISREAAWKQERDERYEKNASKNGSVHASRARYSAENAIAQTEEAARYLSDLEGDPSGLGGLLPAHGA